MTNNNISKSLNYTVNILVKYLNSIKPEDLKFMTNENFLDFIKNAINIIKPNTDFLENTLLMHTIVSCSIIRTNLENKNELMFLLNEAFLRSLPIIENEITNTIKINYSLN